MRSPCQYASGLSPALVIAIAVHAVTQPGDHTAATPIVVRVEHGGFQLVDAAIGALVAIGALLIAGAYVALARLRRAELNSRTGDRQ
ncbi:MAG: hypothetical protein QOK36_220 [Gaiellales bacterium]|jgi:hypothetical protein|nr:hypothetical protein [Gaiellales bacterium]